MPHTSEYYNKTYPNQKANEWQKGQTQESKR